MSQNATHTYQPSDLVLVTGANGHVAQHVVDQLLLVPEGPRVRATVRSDTTAKQISSFYEENRSARGRFEIVVIPDIVKPGAFDDAVKGRFPYITYIVSLGLTTYCSIMSDVTHIA